jgi:glutaminyl-tRNA synthetase
MSTEDKSLHFIEQIIEDSLTSGFPQDKLRFRFPPEPNGYLHIGHAKSICLNFGLGLRYNAPVNLRFDDTNPAKEEQEYVDSITEMVQWLGFGWEAFGQSHLYYASNYFEMMYQAAEALISAGKAYVDEQSADESNNDSNNLEQFNQYNLDFFKKYNGDDYIYFILIALLLISLFFIYLRYK